MLGIILYHIVCHKGEGDFVLLPAPANSNWGSIFVAVFLILSGAMLYYNNSEIDSCKTYFYKRFLAIYPVFYIAWSCFYIAKVILYRSFFWNGHAWTILLSVLGIDKYFSYRLDVTYSSVGEWFNGAIIFLYILYPIFLWLIKRIGIVLVVLSGALCIWQIFCGYFIITTNRNMIYCSFLFIVGMYIMKAQLYKYRTLQLASLAIVCILTFVPIQMDWSVSNLIMGVSMWFALYFIGELLMEKSNKLSKFIVWTSTISYAVYTIHHNFVFAAYRLYSPASVLEVVLFNVGVLIIVFAVGALLYRVSKILVKRVQRISR